MQIEPRELDRRRRAGEDIAILDIREPWEIELCAIDGSLAIPMPGLVERIGEVPRDRPVVVLCHHGVRSLRATEWLRRQGYDNAINLAGGIDAWARQVDQGMRVY